MGELFLGLINRLHQFFPSLSLGPAGLTSKDDGKKMTA